MNQVALVDTRTGEILPFDNDAKKIGDIYRKAKASIVDSVRYQIECGIRLAEKKSGMPHGEWLKWLKNQKDVLDFGERTAQKLITAAEANTTPASLLEPGEATAISRQIWGHDSGRHGNLKGEYEWYTPAPLIEAAREVMGGIDLDPASCKQANEIVKAKTFYTETENGLQKTWAGRVFINPPFAHPTVRHFADKLLESFGSGEVEQAIWLSNACVDVGWWQELAGIGFVCFHRGRIKFYGPDGQLQPPTLGQSIIYLGHNTEGFRKRFVEFGVVLSAPL